MSGDFQDRLENGARNLLLNCAGCEPGQTLLVIYETTADGYYDPELVNVVAETAKSLEIETLLQGVPVDPNARDLDPALASKIEIVDCTVFLARLGDQIRFSPKNGAANRIVSYVLDCDMLASPFGTIHYHGFERMKALINRLVSSASEIRVTCPAGTDFSGTAVRFSEFGGDTTIKRFPVSVFAPVPTQGFSGRVAQVGFLTGTGSNFYTPWACEITETLYIEIDNSRIVGFDGTAKDVAAAKAHYEFVGEKFGIDTYCVHSWHAGIHPGLNYGQPAGQHFERWSGGAFGNPRLLHFHTCGDYPPGEISLNVLDHTVSIDGIAVWDNGVLHPGRIPGASALLAEFPDMRAVFDAPAFDVGQSETGRLAFG